MMTGAVSQPDVARGCLQNTKILPQRTQLHIIALNNTNNKGKPIKNFLGRRSTPECWHEELCKCSPQKKQIKIGKKETKNSESWLKQIEIHLFKKI